MFEPLVPDVQRLLRAVGEPLTLVDVGARNGVRALAAVAPFVDAYGFEPNPAEYEKLATGATDAATAGLAAPDDYRTLTHLPYALSDRSGTATLYITRGPGAVGLLPPDPGRLREIRWKGRRFEPDFASAVFEVVDTAEVPVRTLAEAAEERAIGDIDLLKVDVEGSEHEVLSGAGSALPRIGVVRVEVCFIPFRVGQKLFSEVDLLLRGQGFDLLRYEIDPAQVGYKERETPIGFGPELGFADRWGQPLSADAVYVNRRLTEPARLARQAAVLADLNYLDEAAFTLRKAGLERDLVETLRTFRHERPHHRALKVATRVFHASLATRARLRQLGVRRNS